MVGGPGIAHFISKQHALNEQLHKEYAAAMAAEKPYPTHYTNIEGGEWQNFRVSNSIKFSDGAIYDTKTKSWRREIIDPIAQWERNKAADPLASSGMIQAGEHLVREVKQLRGRIFDLEQERRNYHDERDF